MDHSNRIFTVASEDHLTELIRQARQRLIVICPGLTDRVADAIADQCSEDDEIRITVILDIKPEAYHLGYGTEGGLERLHEAAKKNLLSFKKQPGVRIGVVISDDSTMVFSPAPLLVEADSTSNEEPNAIILPGCGADRLADAAGAGSEGYTDSQEIGREEAAPEEIQDLKDNLKANPPQSFDLARKLRVFVSKVQFVEIKADNYSLDSRQITLTTEILGITNENLKKEVTVRVRALAGASDSFSIWVMTLNGYKLIKVDGKWIARERKRIEKLYTFYIPEFGRMILKEDREIFEKEIKYFKENVESYRNNMLAGIEGIKGNLENSLVNEYLPKWKLNPPEIFTRNGASFSDDDLEKSLRYRIRSSIEKGVSFKDPRVRFIYKNVSPESIEDKEFLGSVEKILMARGVSIKKIESLFSTGTAAAATDDFKA